MSDPVRVLHVIGVMDRGGAETMIMNLYRRIDRTKVQFDFVENSFEPAAFDEEILSLGGRIYRCPHFSGWNYAGYREWWSAFFAEHKDEYRLIHGHIGSTAAIYLKIAKTNGLVTIAHSHNTGDLSPRSAAYKLLSYKTRYIADWFFACSAAAGRNRFGEEVVRSDRFRLLPNAIDTATFRFDPAVREEVRKELSLPDGPVIGHVGRFHRQKNHAFLLKVFAEIVRSHPDSRLLLAGDGPLRGEIAAQAERLGVRDRVIFTGVRSDVDRLLQAMDVLVFPSRFEGLPLTLVEAQAAGLPCVISDRIPEEAVLVDDLVKVRRLEDTPKEWADTVFGLLGQPRSDRSREVASAGYEISDTAKWLQDFYLTRYDEQREKNNGLYADL